MSIKELAAALHRGLSSIAHARQSLADGADTLAQAHEIWFAALAGAAEEGSEPTYLSEQCQANLTLVHERLAALEGALRDYLARIGVSPAPSDSLKRSGTEPPTSATDHSPSRARPTTSESPDGDRYPVEAFWGAHLMDRYSPPGSGIPVTALVRGVGQDVTHEFKPGQQYWSRRATERAKSIKPPAAFWRANITHHVEIQAATWMVDSGSSEAEIIVNRTPCGYRKDLEPQRKAGCHQFLQGFLPQGHTLHVYGTDDHGRRYFIASYEGKNPQ
ncbi:DddA-like double-stranded DNA deaminase toxin [Saccharomonospora saliphila]|uniref:DddA-like double-stranded DNA deaminase toxin n=1 Tax=Saccharomonospora saliphila TaxID=369829 RepID=UPI0003684543|nr:DddA-like double-stranded DNA deaminase toxin [Saccharomonospora saliphila]